MWCDGMGRKRARAQSFVEHMWWTQTATDWPLAVKKRRHFPHDVVARCRRSRTMICALPRVAEGGAQNTQHLHHSKSPGSQLPLAARLARPTITEHLQRCRREVLSKLRRGILKCEAAPHQALPCDGPLQDNFSERQIHLFRSDELVDVLTNVTNSSAMRFATPALVYQTSLAFNLPYMCDSHAGLV